MHNELLQGDQYEVVIKTTRKMNLKRDQNWTKSWQEMDLKWTKYEPKIKQRRSQKGTQNGQKMRPKCSQNLINPKFTQNESKIDPK